MAGNRQLSALSEIEKLVSKVSCGALDESVAFQDRVEALKVLTPYYIALKKERATTDEDDGTMADLAKSIKEPENGPVKVRGYPGRRHSAS